VTLDSFWKSRKLEESLRNINSLIDYSANIPSVHDVPAKPGKRNTQFKRIHSVHFHT